MSDGIEIDSSHLLNDSKNLTSSHGSRDSSNLIRYDSDYSDRLLSVNGYSESEESYTPESPIRKPITRSYSCPSSIFWKVTSSKSMSQAVSQSKLLSPSEEYGRYCPSDSEMSVECSKIQENVKPPSFFSEIYEQLADIFRYLFGMNIHEK